MHIKLNMITSKIPDTLIVNNIGKDDIPMRKR